jgi:hypothetical protein
MNKKIVIPAAVSIGGLCLSLFLANTLHHAPNAPAAIVEYIALIATIGGTVYAAGQSFFQWFCSSETMEH